MSHRNGDPFNTLQGGNRLIDSLPKMLREAVLAQCDRVTLKPGTVLCEAGEAFTHVYFPVNGTISVVRELAGHEPFETENIGREGMLGVTLILDVNQAPQRGIVQTPCEALRMEADAMQTTLHDHAAFSRILQRYLYVAIDALSRSTGCIRYHDVGQRLARGLLVARDRTRTDDLPMTHQLLADMLGVQRGAVTIAAIKLQQEGIIRYTRGKITILDRERLEEKSCECY